MKIYHLKKILEVIRPHLRDLINGNKPIDESSDESNDKSNDESNDEYDETDCAEWKIQLST